MANTYTQIHIQTVFAVKYRSSLLKKEWRADLFRYMTEVLQSNGHKMLAIGGVEDHVHMFFGFRPTETLSDLVRDVKRSSTLWINNNHLLLRRFSWQEGFGAFSYSRNQIRIICNYINSQEEHHRKTTFMEEYIKTLEDFGVDYDKRYVFKDVYSDNL